MKKSDKKKNSKKQDASEAAPVITWQAQLVEYLKAISIAIVLALFIRSFVVQAFHIPSSSMVPTFLEGDRVLVTKFAFGIRNPFTNNVFFETGSPARGDVVIFQYPDDHKTDFVKRVIGLPGETVQIVSGKIMINGEVIEDLHGHYDNPHQVRSRDYGPAVVPQGQYFMMGDNRDYSNDSRVWGFVDASLLRGKAWRLYWSWDSTRGVAFSKRLRIGRLGQKIE
jgi:signal peptidase I